MKTLMRMNRVLGIVFLFLTLFLQKGFSQMSGTIITGIIDPCPIGIATDKTTNLLFPFPISSVNHGSSDVVVQMAQGADNILQLKATTPDFKPTNLTVIGQDRNFYSFLLTYSSESKDFNFRIGSSTLETPVISTETKNAAELIQMSDMVGKKRPMFRRLKSNNYGTSIELQGIYYKNDLLYFQMQIENASLIPYDIEDLRIFIKDRKKGKRTATQEVELTPLNIEGNTIRIEGNSKNQYVFVLRKFTIPDKKHVKIQLMENNGGRHLELTINNKHVIRARTIN